MELFQSGALRGKVLLLYSCSTTDPAFVTELIGASGVHAVVRFTGTVRAADAAHLIELLGKVIGASPPQPFYLEDALDRAIKRFLDQSDAHEKKMREVLRHFVVQS